MLQAARQALRRPHFAFRSALRSTRLLSTMSTTQWFSETEAMWPGQKFCLAQEEVLFHGKSDFQDVLVFKSQTYGNVLVLDGVIQVTERDEFSYQEMISHLPLYSHANPKSVLIVGGGDGGVLREVAKHPSVEKIVMCEIDPMVCDVSKQFFANSLATTFNDPRLTLMHDDAAAYLRNGQCGKYDVIIVDSSDPVGPAEVLFRSEFYENMKNALNPNGIVCTQGECLWLHIDLIADVLGRVGQFFPTVQYAYTTIPTYPSGQIGFVLCSLDESPNALNKPKRIVDEKTAANLRYYNSKIHEAAFVLPSFAEKKIAPVRKTTV
ncbi:spermidine synthase, variant [Saprolegnia diclina VS20]|uniref:Spermidine synthase n=1 Tax=Saprolegnia diclina (strain VS20) TaxID=1156394 RepID=T0QI28_SAPDV|nr:spermidine synthase [Saprolegnia diclina VS20]XP_008609165.1 spermidine synthase, variant [Saprolegnia diclina VS20]EQC37644.1 spermidine synthase [Saprolegnia diclina VS20]EQC37645.1 spermidine synthase, variant [Saprolegnia diclina VS20]|eukprot:XP_008609164.1 spermidine synthase [Saprolegnia diclina VS20]